MLYQHKQVKIRKVSLRQQRGVAIIMALFIVALVASMAYIMMARLERDTERTRLLLRNTQAMFYAEGSIAWAKDQLCTDWQQRRPNQVVDAMPIQAKVMINGYQMISTLEDMQGRFNLNNLTQSAAQNDFVRLLRFVYPDLTQEKAQRITQAIAARLSSSSANEQGQATEAPPTTGLMHRRMVSLGELQQVPDMSPALFNALAPYVVALPTTTLINIQTASAPVFTTLGDTVTLETANAIVQSREKNPFVSVAAFLSRDIIKNHPVSAEKITVMSQYFLLTTRITIEKQQSVLYTLLTRESGENNCMIRHIWQSKGIW